MTPSRALGALIPALMLGAGPALSSTLEEVKARGSLTCGVTGGLAGFSMSDANDAWSGFDVDLCRAVAAAVLGDATRVRFIATAGRKQIQEMTSGEIDMLVRNPAATLTNDAALELSFVATSYYDGQGFMVRKDLGVASAKELVDPAICLQSGSAAETYVTEFFRANNMSFTTLAVSDDAEAQRRYLAGECSVYTGDTSSLAAGRATMADGENHVILPEVISKEPLGPAVRHGDDQWADIVRWTFNALLIAEEKGITKANIEEVAASSQDTEVRRLLGVDPANLPGKLGLERNAFRNAIAAVGNYGESFEANVGASTPIGLPRGLNALWTQGGLQYAPPFR